MASQLTRPPCVSTRPQPLTEGEEEDDEATAARRARGKSLVEARKETWLLEAAQETAKLGENLMNDGLLEMDAAMTASMAALNSALALEESVFHQDAAVTLPAAVDAAALLGPGPAGLAALGDPVSALGGRSSVDTSALINAAALLGPGAGGLLPTSAQPNLLPGADAWDEMEKRMAALQATLEDPGGEGASGSAALDEARLAARGRSTCQPLAACLQPPRRWRPTRRERVGMGCSQLPRWRPPQAAGWSSSREWCVAGLLVLCYHFLCLS